MTHAGLELAGIGYLADATLEDKFTYNGKEKVDDLALNWLDYGARNYDARLGRWWSVDPLAGKFAPVSPYNYALNNPMSLIDPNGMETVNAYEYQKERDGEEMERRRQSREAGGGLYATFVTPEKTVVAFMSVVYNGLNKGGHASFTKVSGNTFKIGIRNLPNGTKLDRGAREFLDALQHVTNSSGRTNITFVYGDSEVVIGQFESGKIDMADILQFDEYQHGKAYQEGPTRQGKLVHELIEQKVKQADGHKYHGIPHRRGISRENAVNGNERLADRSLSGGNAVVESFQMPNSTRVNKFTLQTKDGALHNKIPVIRVSQYYGNE
jgi:RHS repeat-associated protein